MNPIKVTRDKLDRLTDLPNIGKAGEEDLQALGINKPEDLLGLCPYEMHASLCEITGVKHDPCVIDVFISITSFMQGEEPKPWWHYTAQRKEWLKNRNEA